MKKLIVANWKMNPTSLKEAEKLFGSILKTKSYKLKPDLIICPPFVYIEPLSKILNSKFYILDSKLGAQNCFWKDEGAYTGEISPLMLKNLGVEYVIVGHSERRNYLKETDEMIAKKIKAVIENKLTPILCIGETLEQRKRGLAKEIIKNQLEKDLKNISLNSKFYILNSRLIVAYEPVWAIGTGNYCQPKDALKMINYIKDILNSKFLIQNSKVLYGGSVDSKNIANYLKYPEIDGALVGGASIKIEEFKKIINEVSKSTKIKSTSK